MKVLFVASECTPFAKTGGLADVIGSLPKELKKQNIDVRVVIPKYEDIPEYFKEKMKNVAKFSVRLSWRNKYCGVEQYEKDGIIYYFIDNEYYFKRKGLYGHYDEAERFAYFNRAVIEMLMHIPFQPDIIHCHDWQTGLIPLYLKDQYRFLDFYSQMKTVFTIHNLQYQGIFPPVILGDILALGQEYLADEKLGFYGQVSFMKAALNYADKLTTVSPTYAHEIQNPYYGEQLDGVLRLRANDLAGILNGIDYDEFNPMTDPHIYVNYRSSLAKKKENKVKLQEELGLPVIKDIPMIGIVSRLVEQKGFDLVAHVMNEILQNDVQLVVLGTGEECYEHMFLHFAHLYPEKVSANITFNEALARKIYAASDLFLMPSRFEPCGIGQIIALRYGAVPIVRETGGLVDTVSPFIEETGEGNGFTFANYNAHDMLYTIERALNIYKQEDLWKIVFKNTFKRNYSWQQSAKQYVSLYQSLVAS